MIFSSERAGGRNLFWQAADGTGAAERLPDSHNTQYPMAVSPDGRQLIFSEETAQTDIDLMTLELDGTRRVTPLLQSRFAERNAVISPDGRWLAYEANDSGRFEIYVRAFPRRQQESLGRVHWWRHRAALDKARAGTDLCSPTGALMRVGVSPGPSWSATSRRLW